MLDSYILIDDTILTDIATAIREQLELSEDVVYTPNEMVDAILSI